MILTFLSKEVETFLIVLYATDHGIIAIDHGYNNVGAMGEKVFFCSISCSGCTACVHAHAVCVCMCVCVKERER